MAASIMNAAAQSGQLSVRRLAQRVGTYTGLSFIGTAQSLANEMEAWLQQGVSDRFNIMFPLVPAGIDVRSRRVASGRPTID